MEVVHRHEKEAKSVHGVGEWLGQFYILKVIQQEFEGAGHFLFGEQCARAKMPAATECQIGARITPLHVKLVGALQAQSCWAATQRKSVSQKDDVPHCEQCDARCDDLPLAMLQGLDLT